MLKLNRITVFVLIMIFGNALSVPAWCNRSEQANTKQEDSDFVIPAVIETAQPLKFDDPDPARLLRQLEYTIDPEQKSVFLVAISDHLSPRQVDDVQEGILGLISDSMCKAGDVTIIWSSSLRRIATFRNDERVQDCSPKWLKFKVAQNKSDFVSFNRHLQEIKKAGHQGRATLNIGHITHHFGQEFHEYHDFPNRFLILYGSAIAITGAEGAAMETAYPTIGMLRAERSPLSTRDKAWYLGNTVTHFIHTDSIPSRVHRDGLQNFWAGFFLSQGSPLLTFSFDPKVSERVLNPTLPVLPAYVDEVRPGFVAISAVPILDDFSGASIPTRLERGSLQLALKWADTELDLDLHVGMVNGGERLSFRNPRTEFGTLRKNFGTGWEEVSLTQEVSPQEVEVWVNFFRGSTSGENVSAELRVAYAGTLHRLPITMTATSGNEGRGDSADHWVQIDLQKVLAGGVN